MTVRQNATESQMAPSPWQEEYDLRDIVKVLRRRRSVIIGSVLVLTTLAALVSSHLTPEYTAVSTIVVEPRGTRILNFENDGRDLPPDTSLINTHIKLLTSTSFVNLVIDRLELLDDPGFNVSLRDERAPGKLDAFINTASSWARAPLVAVGLANDLAPGAPDRLRSEDGGRSERPAPETARPDPSDSELGPLDGSGSLATDEGASESVAVGTAAPLEDEQRGTPSAVDDRARDALSAAATGIFLEQLAVAPFGQSYAVSVAFTSKDPETAARVANAMAELYVEHQLESKRATTTGALDWLDRRLSELRTQLVQAEQAAEAYRAENELIASGDRDLAALNQELIRARAERIAIEAKLDRIRQLRSRGERMDSVPEVIASPVIANLRQQETQLLRQEAQLRQEYGTRHPSVVQLQADKENLADRIEAEIHNILGSLENQIGTIRVREEALQANMEQAKIGAVQDKRAAIQLRLLEREAESTRALYATFLNRFKELTEQREMLEAGVRVISTASVPTKPSFPQVKLITGAGFMGSLLLATLLAFVVDRLDSGLRTGRQVEEVLKVSQIGFVPRIRRVARLTPQRYLAERPTSAYAEAIRTVQTALHFSNVDRPPRVVLVTSSLPAEGKTTFALSLAALLARSGSRTVVVDLDLRRPTLGRNLKARSGDLIDFMAGEKSLDEILYPDNEVDNLDVVPVKHLTASPTELLASRKMAALIAELRSRYDYVILDSPPLLGIPDSRFAALLAEAVVFVVRWSKTRDELALKALGILREGGAPVAGVVLTQVNVRRHRKYGPEDVVHYYGTYKRYYVN